MLLRLVRLPLHPHHVAEFLRLFATSEARIRAQPGCLRLAAGPDASRPATYCTVSYWRDAAALDAYRHSEFFGQVWPATKRLLAAPAEAFSVELEDSSEIVSSEPVSEQFTERSQSRPTEPR